MKDGDTGAARRMNLARRQIEAQRLGAANIPRRKAMEWEFNNYTLSLMLHKRHRDQCPKVDAAAANQVGSLA